MRRRGFVIGVAASITFVAGLSACGDEMPVEGPEESPSVEALASHSEEDLA